MIKVLALIIAINLIVGDQNWRVYLRDYSFVADHLNAQGCNGCDIKKLVYFGHAERGIFRGLYMYKFAVTDAEGNIWDVIYESYEDLEPDTVDKGKIKKKPHSDDGYASLKR